MGAGDQDLTSDEAPAPAGTDAHTVGTHLSNHIQGQFAAPGEDDPPPHNDPDDATHQRQPEPPGGEFEEDQQPGGEFIEDQRPTRDTVLRQKEWNAQQSMHKTRTWLALGLLILVGLLALAPTTALMFGNKLHFNAESYREVNSMFTPVIALASAAFGFFFASSDDRNRR